MGASSGRTEGRGIQTRQRCRMRLMRRSLGVVTCIGGRVLQFIRGSRRVFCLWLQEGGRIRGR